MQSPNRILERIREGKKALGLAMQYPQEYLIEAAGRMGLDFVSLDGQHGVMSPELIETMCRVADGYGITVGVRVPDQEESTLFLYLDRGVKMIIVPNLETAEDAERLLKYCFYGPIGRRSATSLRVIFSAGGDATNSRAFFDFTNENTIVVPQLESITAFENLDEILEVDGIDYFAGGPQDIAQSMGYHGQPDHPACVEAYEQACEKVRAAGKHMIQDVTTSVDVLGAIHSHVKAMMADYDRESALKM
ncbi:aldolase/citrate lyase family protein [bacterium]|jgi:4-hydroxy-2-oxoheptanedioate aldolase|nr:aldolase/citrate lyase family protein [bacterium]